MLAGTGTLCVSIGATGGSGCCSGVCGAGGKLGGTWDCDGAPSEDIGGTGWAHFLLGFPFLGGAQTVLC